MDRQRLVISPERLEDRRALRLRFGTGQAESLGDVEVGQRLLEAMQAGACPRTRQKRQAVGGEIARKLLCQVGGAFVVGNAAEDLSAEHEQVDQLGPRATRQAPLR